MAEEYQGLVRLCVCVEVGKMAKDIGMTIRKGIVVYGMLLVSVVFCGEKLRYEWCLDGVVV